MTGLGIVRTERRAFDGNSPLAGDPALRRYLSDMVGPYGLAVREDVLDAGLGHSYGEMAESLIGALAKDPVDLLIIAYGVHDVRLGRATATYLSGRCPGEPLSFAVCDQGTAAAFSALRMIGAYRCRRALLLVLEQAVLHYEPAADAPVPGRHAAVGFLLEECPRGMTVNQHAGLPPDRVPAVLAAEVAELAAGRDVTLIVDGALQPIAESIVDDVRPAREGQPYTGTWWELSGGLDGWRDRDRLVLLAEYDPRLRYLCVAACS
jgi:4-hydroxymandelate oxidase